MEIRHHAQMKLLYQNTRQIITDSAEWIFMQRLCNNKIDEAMDLFEETKQFINKKCALDTPSGRFEGKDNIRTFLKKWMSEYSAQSASVEAYFQTRAGGRSATEVIVSFIADGMINEIPMMIIGDLRAHEKLDEVRIYHHCSYLPQYQPYRKPIFQSAHLEMGDPDLLTGAVREYYVALHHVPRVDVERILACTSENCKFGGYGPGSEQPLSDSQILKREYEHMATYIPRWVGMRYETIIDDGITCVIEWVHIVSDDGEQEGGRVCLSGVAAYQRDQDGLLCSIRICDYAGYEKQIDWSKVSISRKEAFLLNHVNHFPAGCGRKKQENM